MKAKQVLVSLFIALVTLFMLACPEPKVKKRDRQEWNMPHFFKTASVDEVREYLKAGANPNDINSDKQTPIYNAVNLARWEVVEVLYTAGANIFATEDSNGKSINNSRSPFMVAYQLFTKAETKYEIKKALIKLFKYTTKPENNKGGGTILHKAVQNGNPDCINAILALRDEIENFIDLSLKDKTNKTALDYYKEFKNQNKDIIRQVKRQIKEKWGSIKTADFFAQSITPADLEKHLQIIASDEYEGRAIGNKKIRRYLRNFYQNKNIDSPLKNALKDERKYFQKISKRYIWKKIKSNTEYEISLSKVSKKYRKDDYNVIAYIEGSEKPEEVVIVGAHMDALGTTCDNPMITCDGGKIFNGADDNGSGTVALLEIAEAFQMAKQLGHEPKRSIMFIHFVAEEAGMIGSQYYVEHPVFPLEKTVLKLNMDMIGISKKDRNYVYLYGWDTHSSKLDKIHDEINKKYISLDLDKIPNTSEIFKRSDHYNFIKKNIPALFYFSGTHPFYHTLNDSLENNEYLHYPTLAKRAKLVFYVAWEFANREERLVVDTPYDP